MKKLIFALLSIALLSTATACTDKEAQPQQKQFSHTDTVVVSDTSTSKGIQPAYDEIISNYVDAINAGKSAEDFIAADMNYLVLISGDPLKDVGYTVIDLDGDGVEELIIGAMDTTPDPFYEKMVFDLYTLDPEGKAVTVFSGWERNRYYYAGENKFAHSGSGSAFNGFNTTETYNAGEMTDTGVVPAEADYVQLQLTALGA